ncbi:MAG: metal ABC transporter ATP-binding protein [Clostridiales bacterium]|nr:metal ABC transporter ATP-binding protein [Clostridiales bacterium]
MAEANGCGLCKIKVNNISVKKGSDVLLRDVSFELHCGELTALIGVNGAGKTTLLRAILGEIHHSGNVTYESHDGKTLERVTIGYVPQFLDFDRSTPVSVRDFLLCGRTGEPVCLRRPKALCAEVEKALAAVGAAELASRRLGELSGGEMQRVMLASALYPVPELLILDEPVSGVDTLGSERFYESISELRKNYHMSIVMVSHDLQLVRRHADKVLLINRQVLCHGDVDYVYSSKEFRTAFTGGALE